MSSGFPNFIVGAVAFGMVLIGVVPATAVGAAIPIILTAAAGMFLATICSARIGESASAGISGIVGSFFLSYSLLVLGLTHNWYGIAPTAVAETQKVFVISWMVIVTMLVLATLGCRRSFKNDQSARKRGSTPKGPSAPSAVTSRMQVRRFMFAFGVTLCYRRLE